jgi:hypothetical protein
VPLEAVLPELALVVVPFEALALRCDVSAQATPASATIAPSATAAVIRCP